MFSCLPIQLSQLKLLHHEHLQPIVFLAEPKAQTAAYLAVEVLPWNLQTALGGNPPLTLAQQQAACIGVAAALEFLAAHGLYFDRVLPNNVGLTPLQVVKICVLDLPSIPPARDAEAAACRGLATFLEACLQASPSLRGCRDVVAVAQRCREGALTRLGDLVVQLMQAGGSWALQWHQLEFVKLLGSGQFGEVRLMRYVDGNRLVAVKTLINPVGERVWKGG